MRKEKLNRYGTFLAILLIAISAISGIAIWARYTVGSVVEISLPPNQPFQGGIYLTGAIANPGFYPLEAGDSLETLLRAAGGATSSADLSRLRLDIPQVGEGKQPQKVDLNRAEAWLLEALPGIGQGKAQAIIDYRRENGPFRSISELVKVKGIGTATYEELKHLITVGD